MNVAVIGGSGLYQWGAASAAEPIRMDTPYGTPSGPIYRSQSKNNTVLFLARHGEHHRFLPSEINYRANLFALKKLGAQCVLSVSAVGSLREEIAPGDFVLPDQYADLTRGRPSTFFGEGVVGHVSFGTPSCESLRGHLRDTMKELGIRVHTGGTYVCIEGPAFSTRAESQGYRSWPGLESQISVIGMTAMPEAKLAREAGLCYQTLAMATDYDCWRSPASQVSVEDVIQVMGQNIARCRTVLLTAVTTPFPTCRSHCREIVKHSILTPSEHWPEARRKAVRTLLEPASAD